MLRSLAFASILALCAASADAQEAIPTAASAVPPDASKEPPPPPLRQNAMNGYAPVQPGPCGTGPTQRVAPVDANGDPQVDRSPHGEVSAGVDSRGGHFVQGAVCVPVGDNGFVAVSAGQGQGGAWKR